MSDARSCDIVCERLFVAGLAALYAFEASEDIPGQWQRFAPHIGQVPGQMGPEAYGVSRNFDDAGTFEYLVGVRVRDFTGLPNDLTAMTIEPRRYAVFTHHGHVGALHRVHLTIWNDWAPKSGAKIASAPNFELYTKDFSRVTGLGGIEIWVPVDCDLGAMGVCSSRDRRASRRGVGGVSG